MIINSLKCANRFCLLPRDKEAGSYLCPTVNLAPKVTKTLILYLTVNLALNLNETLAISVTLNFNQNETLTIRYGPYPNLTLKLSVTLNMKKLIMTLNFLTQKPYP